MVDRYRNLDQVYAAIALIPIDPNEKARLHERVRKYRTECGCAMSGAFLAAALLATIIHLFVTDSFEWRSVAVGLAFIVGAAVTGKALGLAWARTRLLLLRRSITRQLAGN